MSMFQMLSELGGDDLLALQGPGQPPPGATGEEEASKIPFFSYGDQEEAMTRRPMGVVRSPYEGATSINENDPAAVLFDQFCSANTFQGIVSTFQQLCDLVGEQPRDHQVFYHQLKGKLNSWKAQSLWNRLDKRACNREYRQGTACKNTRVLVIGGGPCGLRVGIEVALLGGKAVVVEKRDRFSRNNVLHLWPYIIHDLKGLGAKKFFGKFCAGSIDHISIRALQCILAKVALLVGVEIHPGVSFECLIEPSKSEDGAEVCEWKADVLPSNSPVSEFAFDVLVGADGKRNTLSGFRRKEFRGKLAIAITANFINRNTQAEACVEEISGVAYIFNQKFFKDLNAQTGIDLENIVYYKDDTHYFVMTAKKHSLLLKGVLIQDFDDPARLLNKENVDQEALLAYAKEAADVSTRRQLPNLDFAHNHYGQPDVAMFDFTSMFAAEHASRVMERNSQKLLVSLVGDSLLEPFWPTGSGCARGFLGAQDTAWMIRSWASGKNTPLEVMAERESIYQLLSQTTPENLNKNFSIHTIDPNTRYPNLNPVFFKPHQVTNQYDGSDKAYLNEIVQLAEQRSNRYEMIRNSHNLLKWFQRELESYRHIVKILDLTSSFMSGLALGALIHKYRPELIDIYGFDASKTAENSQKVFDVAEQELSIPAVASGRDMARGEIPDKLTFISYLSQFYEYFRKESVRPAKIARPAPQIKIRTKPRSPGSKMSLLNKMGQRIRQRRSQKLLSDSDSQEEFEKDHDSDTLKRSRQQTQTQGMAKKRLQDFDDDGQVSSLMMRTYKRLEGLEPEEEEESKLSKIRREMKTLKAGVRGKNKVSALAKDLSRKFEGKKTPPEVKKVTTRPLIQKPAAESDQCYFCKKTVYLVERYTAEGLFFHRGCFRCEYCGIALRIGGYAYMRTPGGEAKFYCHQHFGMKRPFRKARKRSLGDKESSPQVGGATKNKDVASTPSSQSQIDGRVPYKTPERIEYVTESEQEESELEQTQHNLSVNLLDEDEEDSESESSEDELAFGSDEMSEEELSLLELAKSYSKSLRKSYDKKSKKGRRSQNGAGDEDSDTETETRTIGASDADYETGSDTERESDTDSIFGNAVGKRRRSLQSQQELSGLERSKEQSNESNREKMLLSPTALKPFGYTSIYQAPKEEPKKETKPSPSNNASARSRMSFFSAVSEPVRIDAMQFLGLRSPPKPPTPEPVEEPTPEKEAIDQENIGDQENIADEEAIAKQEDQDGDVTPKVSDQEMQEELPVKQKGKKKKRHRRGDKRRLTAEVEGSMLPGMQEAAPVITLGDGSSDDESEKEKEGKVDGSKSGEDSKSSSEETLSDTDDQVDSFEDQEVDGEKNMVVESGPVADSTALENSPVQGSSAETSPENIDHDLDMTWDELIEIEQSTESSSPSRDTKSSTSPDEGMFLRPPGADKITSTEESTTESSVLPALICDAPAGESSTTQPSSGDNESDKRDTSEEVKQISSNLDSSTPPSMSSLPSEESKSPSEDAVQANVNSDLNKGVESQDMVTDKEPVVEALQDSTQVTSTTGSGQEHPSTQTLSSGVTVQPEIVKPGDAADSRPGLSEAVEKNDTEKLSSPVLESQKTESSGSEKLPGQSPDKDADGMDVQEEMPESSSDSITESSCVPSAEDTAVTISTSGPVEMDPPNTEVSQETSTSSSSIAEEQKRTPDLPSDAIKEDSEGMQSVEGLTVLNAATPSVTTTDSDTTSSQSAPAPVVNDIEESSSLSETIPSSFPTSGSDDVFMSSEPLSENIQIPAAFVGKTVVLVSEERASQGSTGVSPKPTGKTSPDHQSEGVSEVKVDTLAEISSPSEELSSESKAEGSISSGEGLEVSPSAISKDIQEAVAPSSGSSCSSDFVMISPGVTEQSAAAETSDKRELAKKPGSIALSDKNSDKVVVDKSCVRSLSSVDQSSIEDDFLEQNMDISPDDKRRYKMLASEEDFTDEDLDYVMVEKENENEMMASVIRREDPECVQDKDSVSSGSELVVESELVSQSETVVSSLVTAELSETDTIDSHSEGPALSTGVDLPSGSEGVTMDLSVEQSQGDPDVLKAPSDSKDTEEVMVVDSCSDMKDNVNTDIPEATSSSHGQVKTADTKADISLESKVSVTERKTDLPMEIETEDLQNLTALVQENMDQSSLNMDLTAMVEENQTHGDMDDTLMVLQSNLESDKQKFTQTSNQEVQNKQEDTLKALDKESVVEMKTQDTSAKDEVISVKEEVIKEKSAVVSESAPVGNVCDDKSSSIVCEDKKSDLSTSDKESSVEPVVVKSDQQKLESTCVTQSTSEDKKPGDSVEDEASDLTQLMEDNLDDTSAVPDLSFMVAANKPHLAVDDSVLVSDVKQQDKTSKDTKNEATKSQTANLPVTPSDLGDSHQGKSDQKSVERKDSEQEEVPKVKKDLKLKIKEDRARREKELISKLERRTFAPDIFEDSDSVRDLENVQSEIKSFPTPIHPTTGKLSRSSSGAMSKPDLKTSTPKGANLERSSSLGSPGEDSLRRKCMSKEDLQADAIKRIDDLLFSLSESQDQDFDTQSDRPDSRMDTEEEDDYREEYDSSQIVSFTVDDDAGLEKSFCVNEKFVNTRDRKRHKTGEDEQSDNKTAKLDSPVSSPGKGKQSAVPVPSSHSTPVSSNKIVKESDSKTTTDSHSVSTSDSISAKLALPDDSVSIDGLLELNMNDDDDSSDSLEIDSDNLSVDSIKLSPLENKSILSSHSVNQKSSDKGGLPSDILSPEDKTPFISANSTVVGDSDSSYFTPNASGMNHVLLDSEKKKSSPSSSPISQHYNKCDATTIISDTLSETSDQKSLHSNLSQLSSSSTPYSPNTVKDAKWKFFAETAQPVRIDPVSVFKDIPRKNSKQFNNMSERNGSVLASNMKNIDKSLQLNSNWKGLDSGTPTSPTAAVPHKDAISGENDVFYTPATSVKSQRPNDIDSRKGDVRKRLLPATPGEKSRGVTASEIRDAKEQDLEMNRADARERARLKSDEELGITNKLFKRPESAAANQSKTAEPKAASSQQKRPMSAMSAVTAGKSDSSTLSSTDSPLRPQSDSPSDNSGASPRLGRKGKKDKNKGKKSKEDKENQETGDGKKKRSFLSLLMPSRNVDRKDKDAKSPPPDARTTPGLSPPTGKERPATAQDKRQSFEKKKSHSTASAVQLRSKPSKPYKGYSVDKVKEEELAENRRSMYDEFAPLMDDIAEVSKKNKVNLQEKMEQLAPTPAKAPNTSLRPPKATMDEFETESEAGDDKISVRSFQAITQAMSEEELARMLKKQQRAVVKRQKEQERKRLRTAQEIQRQLEEVEIQQRQVEQKGITVEMALRGEGKAIPNSVEDADKDESELMQEWFNIVHEKNMLVRYESELMVHARELELEDRQGRLEHQLRELMTLDERGKEKQAEEKKVLQELLEVVEQRDALVALLEEDRLKERRQDRHLSAIMDFTGLQLSPVAYVSKMNYDELRGAGDEFGDVFDSD